MTYEQPPQNPYEQPSSPVEPAGSPRPNRSRLWLIFAGVFALVVVIASTVSVTLAVQGGTPTASATRPLTTVEEPPLLADEAPEPDPTPEPAAVTPSVRDIALTAKITDKECFGSSGCSVEFKVNAEYVGPVLSTDDTWLITYQVNGVEDGPMIGSFELTGTEYQVNEESVDTNSSKSKITIKVTSVEKVGL